MSSGEGRRIGQGDPAGLAAAHGQTGHGTVLRIGDYAILFLHHRDDVRQEDHLEIVVAAAPSRLGCGHLLGILPDEMDVLALAVVHDHDERNRLALGNQVVQDLTGMALRGPTLLILGVAMLEVQDRVFLIQVLLVLRGQIDEAVPHALGRLGPVISFFDDTLRHVLDLPEIHVGGRDLDAAAPAAGAKEIDAAGIGHRGAVDIQLIVVESDILGVGRTGPDAVLILGHFVPLAGDVQLDGLGLRGPELRPDRALGVHHGILVTQLVGDVRLEIFNGSGEGRNDGAGFRCCAAADTAASIRTKRTVRFMMWGK